MSQKKTDIAKICIVTPEYPPDQWGGLALTVERAACHIRDMGMEVHVAHFTITDDPLLLLDEGRQDDIIDGIIVHRLSVGKEDLSGRPLTIWDCPHTRTFKMMYQSLELLHDAESFDLFHSFFLYPLGYITGLLARKAGRPSIVTIVGNDVKKYIFSPEKVAMCRSGLENADRVVALSRDLLDTADALTQVKDKGRVIFNSVEIPAESWKTRDKNRVCRIGCAGIFKYAKGLPYLFKAIARLRRQHDIVLELTGTLRASEEQTYKTMLEKTGIEDILLFSPAIPHDRITEWLSGLDAFVLPSVSEGCPNILMEAMAFGLPCVAARVGAVEDLMEDGVSGLIVPWGNSHAVAHALERLIMLPDKGLSISAAARERMKEFSGERERKALEKLYSELLFGKKV
jgi:glycosyltransferase involved in cell wall biosynthesis